MLLQGRMFTVSFSSNGWWCTSFLVVALHTNYMTQFTLRFKTSDSLPLVEHSSMKSSQMRNTYSLRLPRLPRLPHLPRPQVCMYNIHSLICTDYTVYVANMPLVQPMATVMCSISPYIPVHVPLNTGSSSWKGQTIQFWSLSTSCLIIAEHSKAEQCLVIEM